ncbi:MAG: phosphotransferase [Sulfurimonas sp.]
MGVNIHITLKEVNTLFPNYNFTELTPTTDGVIDTTYIVANKQKSYILKHFDRDIEAKIDDDKKLLKQLSRSGLNVPLYIDENRGWYLFKRLKGVTPKTVRLCHIQTLARFMAKYHSLTYKQTDKKHFFDHYAIEELLLFTKQNFYRHYKELEVLKYTPKLCDGFIHGDIFIDNTVFEKDKIGVFDFIDGGCGPFAFDIAVAMLSFNPKNRPSYLYRFLDTYNQSAPKKLFLAELTAQLKLAKKLYALLRIGRTHNTKTANKLIFR